MILKNCNSEEFIKRLNGRKVICFGAGSLLKEYSSLSLGKINNLEKHIAFFLDNDEGKHGLSYEYNNEIFSICNLSILEYIDISKYVLLITSNAYIQIYQQLQKINKLKNIDCYFYRMVTNFPDKNLKEFFNSETSQLLFKNFKSKLIDLKLKDKYKGKRCFLIGNGPSLKIEDLEFLKDEITFASNRIYLTFNETNWRPTYYMCSDFALYVKDCEQISNLDCRYKFVPLMNSIYSCKIYDDNIYYIQKFSNTYIENYRINCINKFPFSYDIINCIYYGYTVLYELLQIAVYMGFSEIYLLGVDCTAQNELLPDGTVIYHENIEKTHFSEQYEDGIQNLFDVGSPLYKSIQAWQSAKEACEKVGVTIKNATRGGKLEVFERVDFDELMKNN